MRRKSTKLCAPRFPLSSFFPADVRFRHDLPGGVPSERSANPFLSEELYVADRALFPHSGHQRRVSL